MKVRELQLCWNCRGVEQWSKLALNDFMRVDALIVNGGMGRKLRPMRHVSGGAKEQTVNFKSSRLNKVRRKSMTSSWLKSRVSSCEFS